MTIQLEWPPEVLDRVTEEARRSGRSLNDYVLDAVIQRSSAGAPLPDDESSRRAREEAGRSIRELRKGNILGVDLTIRELVEEGRRF